MNALSRILAFGLVSGVLWSAAPGVLADLFSAHLGVTTTIIAGVVTGIITSAILAAVVTRFERRGTIVFGFISLPLGAFVFGAVLALVTGLVPVPTSGTLAVIEPWRQGANYALLSVISVFAIGLFPLAVGTTLLLRSFLLHGRRMNLKSQTPL